MNIIKDIPQHPVVEAQITHNDLASTVVEAMNGLDVTCRVINTQQPGPTPNKLTVQVTSAKSADEEQEFLDTLNRLLSAKGVVCKKAAAAHHYECKPISG